MVDNRLINLQLLISSLIISIYLRKTVKQS